MYYVKLPFGEDLREFDFENLDVAKRNQPSDEQLKAVDQLITTMDLTHAEGDEEALRPESVFNPYIQRMFQVRLPFFVDLIPLNVSLQAIARRAVTPDEPLSLSNSIIEMNENLVRSITTKSKRTVDAIQEQFTLRDTDRRKKITTGDALFGQAEK